MDRYEEQQQAERVQTLNISNGRYEVIIDDEQQTRIALLASEEETVGFQESEFEQFWENNQNNLRYGTYRVTFSRLGIEQIRRVERVFYEAGVGDDSDEEQPQPQHINNRSGSCVLCLDENVIPDILFCSCGHVCICNGCIDFYHKKECPVCKAKSDIIRKI